MSTLYWGQKKKQQNERWIRKNYKYQPNKILWKKKVNTKISFKA
jgi:hypothetical protein